MGRAAAQLISTSDKLQPGQVSLHLSSPSISRMTVEYTPLVLDNGHFSDVKRHLRDKVIGWDGLARVDTITSEQAELVKILETQSTENKIQTVTGQLDLYSQTLLNILNKLKPTSDDVLKKILVLINDLLLDIPQFVDSLLNLSSIDASLPFNPFLKFLGHDDNLIKSLCLYNLTILLTKHNFLSSSSVDKEVLIQSFDLLASPSFIGNFQDLNLQSIGIQLLQELVIIKSFRLVFQNNNLISNFKSINQLVSNSAKQPNSSNLQLSYNTLLTTWVLSFSAAINKSLIHNYPDLIGNLLTISKDSIKLKIVRISISILKNFVSITTSPGEQFKIIKLVLFHDGLNVIKTLKERKFASNGSDEELSNDLNYLNDILNEIVTNKLTSFDEYLTELENPHLLSWSSPTHKSNEFWLENSHNFKDSGFKLVKKMLEVLASSNSQLVAKVIILNDLQFLIKNLGQDLVTFINTDKDGEHKILIMGLLENHNGDNELKYEALKTIQLLVGHNY